AVLDAYRVGAANDSPQGGRAVIDAPRQVRWRPRTGHVPLVRVYVGRVHQHEVRKRSEDAGSVVPHKARNVMSVFFAPEQAPRAVQGPKALVNVATATVQIISVLSHEGRRGAHLRCDLLRRALIEHRPIRGAQGVSVVEIDL